MKESDMYPPLKQWLENQGYTVYPEIEPRPGGPRADIVAVKDDQLTIIEMKTSFGLAVMEQADHWASGGHAHQTYIAVPWRDGWQLAPIAKRALEQVGVGILRVDLRSNPNGLDGLEERLAWIREKNEQRAKEYRDRINCPAYGGITWKRLRSVRTVVITLFILNKKQAALFSLEHVSMERKQTIQECTT